MDLTAKQRMFADEYIKTGNAEDAARKAGYSVATARGHSHKLLQNVAVKEYIANCNKTIQKATIADMTEVKEFWSSLLRSKEIEPRDRLKASELIAKTNGAFIDKVETTAHNTNVNLDVDVAAFKRKATPEELLRVDTMSYVEIEKIMQREG